MKFNAMLSFIIPGNFISWRIVLIDGISKKVAVPSDYDLEGVEEVLETIGIQVPPPTLGQICVIKNTEALSTAVFEFEKIGRKRFKILKHIGELKQVTKTSIDTTQAGAI